MREIIINADDYGINEVVTSEIERMILSRSISSTSIMANGACLDRVQKFARNHPEASFGIHLCLSEFDSVTKSDALHRFGLTNALGQFIPKAVFNLTNLNEKAALRAIRDELNAQIDIVSSLGFHISHADSHHHVHTIYSLRGLFAEVLRERGIKRIRIGAGFHTLRMKVHINKWVKRIRLNKYYKSNFRTVDAFYSYSEYIKRCPLNHDDCIIELMCHPGHPGIKYLKEMQLVREKELLNIEDVKLITYNDI